MPRKEKSWIVKNQATKRISSVENRAVAVRECRYFQGEIVAKTRLSPKWESYGNRRKVATDELAMYCSNGNSDGQSLFERILRAE